MAAKGELMHDVNSIRAHLAELVENLKVGAYDQAEATIYVLEFDRWLRPLRDPSKGPIQFIDPAEASGIGSERAHQVGDHLHRVASCLRGGDTNGALLEAEAALTRWDAER